METQTITKTWRDFVPATTYLYEAPDNLDRTRFADVLDEVLKSNADSPLWCKLVQYGFDDWHSLSQELDDILKAMTKEGLEDEFDEHADDIMELLRERDRSDLIGDTFSRMLPLNMFYELGGWYEQFPDHYSPERIEQLVSEDVAHMCKALNLPEDCPQAETLRLIRHESPYGGKLRIYFRTDIRNMLCPERPFDAPLISFKGVFSVAIWNPYCGSGYFEDMELDMITSFDRPRLSCAEAEDCDIISSCGLIPDPFPEISPKLI